MIHLFNKNSRLSHLSGAVTLILTVILLVLSTLIIFVSAGYNRLETKATANFVHSQEAFEAAEAGEEFAISYLSQHASTITANPVSGYFPPYSDSSTTNISLANGSTFTAVYTNPKANNYNLILITSTGTSSDGSSTRVIKQQVMSEPIVTNIPTAPLTSAGSASLSGNSNIINIINDSNDAKTITSGGAVSLSGSSKTTTSTGGSSPGNIGSDIQSNNPSLQGISSSNFFQQFFSSAASNVQSAMAHVFSSATGATLSGLTNTSIWVNNSVSLSGNVTVGSATAPVLLIINGSLSISGTVSIYGFVYVTGSTSISGNTNIVGSLATAGAVSLSGNIKITYDSTIMNTVANNTLGNTYSKIPGTWSDF